VKTFCERCRRETFDTLPMGVSFARMEAACDRSDRVVNGGRRDCDTFAAGRRAGLAEALRLAKSESIWMTIDGDYVLISALGRVIRKAMKPARVKV
jgi:hypothetical protein